VLPTNRLQIQLTSQVLKFLLRKRQITKSLFYFLVAEISSCADEEDIKISCAKVNEWHQKNHFSDYGSVSSYEEHDKTDQDLD